MRNSSVIHESPVDSPSSLSYFISELSLLQKKTSPSKSLTGAGLTPNQT
jgi:hypothetical protein